MVFQKANNYGATVRSSIEKLSRSAKKATAPSSEDASVKESLGVPSIATATVLPLKAGK